MKKFQNDFTTPEQSKRLLELGVPADSANCWICIDKSDSTYKIKVFHSHNYSYIENYYNEMNRKEEMYIDILPCWSVGRLIEIYHICVGPGCSFTFHVCFPNLMNEIIYKLGEAHRNGWLDLKKLEE